MGDPNPDTTSWNRGIVGWAAVVLLVGLTTLAYAPSLSGGFLIDDDVLLTDSPLIKAPDGLWKFWFTTEAIDYWPVFNTSFWVEWRMWGMQPLGYRASSLILHITESLLLWRILYRLGIPGAFLGALLFAIHPVNVESVAWISQRKTLLAMLFMQLSALAYLRSDGEARIVDRTRAPRPDTWYWLAVAAFACAMLSKVSAAVFPALLLWVMIYSRPLASREITRMIPFALVGFVLVGVNIWYRANDPNLRVEIDPLESMLRGSRLVWFYLSKAIFPIDLHFMYATWHVDVARWEWWTPLIAIFAMTILFLRYRRRWSGPVLYAWGFYCLALLPALGLTEEPFVEDHYQHLALVAVTTLGAAAWASWGKRAPLRLRHASTLAAVAVVAVLTVLTWRHAATYTSNVALMRAAVEADPNAAVTHRNLGFVLFRAGQQGEALRQLEEALRLDPKSREAHKAIAVVLAATGDKSGAIAHLQSALRLAPDDAEALGNLGSFLRETGRAKDAMPYLQHALQLDPDAIQTRCNLGKAMLEVGEMKMAVEQFEQVLRIDPGSAEATRLLVQAKNAAQHPNGEGTRRPLTTNPPGVKGTN